MKQQHQFQMSLFSAVVNCLHNDVFNVAIQLQFSFFFLALNHAFQQLSVQQLSAFDINGLTVCINEFMFYIKELEPWVIRTDSLNQTSTAVIGGSELIQMEVHVFVNQKTFSCIFTVTVKLAFCICGLL